MKLRAWRTSFKKLISLAKMAVLCGYKKTGASKVYYWENGRIPKPKDIAKIDAITRGKVKLKDFYEDVRDAD